MINQSEKIFLLILMLLFVGLKVYCVYTMLTNNARANNKINLTDL